MVHRITSGFDPRKLMWKERYDPNDDGKIALSIIDIDCDLNMGSHNIILDSGYKVDNVDIDQHTHSLSLPNKSDSFTAYTHDHKTEEGEYTVLETSLNVDSPHILIYYKVGLLLYTIVGDSKDWHKVRLYVNNNLKVERWVEPTLNEEKEFPYWDIVEGITGTNIPIKVTIYKTGDDEVKMSGKYMVVTVYHLEPPT